MLHDQSSSFIPHFSNFNWNYWMLSLFWYNKTELNLQIKFISHIKMQPNLCSQKLGKHFGEVHFIVLISSKDTERWKMYNFFLATCICISQNVSQSKLTSNKIACFDNVCMRMVNCYFKPYNMNHQKTSSHNPDLSQLQSQEKWPKNNQAWHSSFSDRKQYDAVLTQLTILD